MSFDSDLNQDESPKRTKVYLNVYDLTKVNGLLYPAGLGLNHTGVEVMGSEYSYATGVGIVESTPKEAPVGATFRESIDLGSFEKGGDLKHAIANLSREFGPRNYNLFTKNCNHFSNAIVFYLLEIDIPSHINRMADMGSYVSCLLPKQVLEGAPVGGNSRSGGIQVYRGENISGFGWRFT